jgi:hypothetical protein
MLPPWRQVPDLPVRPPVADETFGDPFLPGLLKSGDRQTQDLRDRAVRIKAPPLPVGGHDQKQVQDHCFMAQAMQISALQDLVVDDGIAPGPAHGSSVE